MPNSGSCGDHLTYEQFGDTLVVTGSGFLTGFDGMRFPGGIKRVKLPDGVTGIGIFAFKNFTNLADIDLPAAVQKI